MYSGLYDYSIGHIRSVITYVHIFGVYKSDKWVKRETNICTSTIKIFFPTSSDHEGERNA